MTRYPRGRLQLFTWEKSGVRFHGPALLSLGIHCDAGQRDGLVALRTPRRGSRQRGEGDERGKR